MRVFKNPTEASMFPYPIHILLQFLLAIHVMAILKNIVFMRRRAKQFPVVSAFLNETVNFTKTPSDSSYLFCLTEATTLTDAQKQSVKSHMDHHDLAVLELVPENLRAEFAQYLLKAYVPKSFRKNPLSPSVSAFSGIALTLELAKRSGTNEESQILPWALPWLSDRLKKYAPTSTDLAIVKGLSESSAMRPAKNHAQDLNAFFYPPLIFSMATYLFIALAPWISTFWGILVLGLFHLEPLLIFIKTPFHIKNLFQYSLFRWPMDVYQILCLLGWFSKAQPKPEPKAILRKKAWYQEKNKLGVSAFFEARKEACPLCQSKDLKAFLRAPDVHQGKPGRFVLEQCKNCKHIFQNPRPNTEGLSYYYKDFYDGTGKNLWDRIFGYSENIYKERASDITPYHTPKRWLDVGSGQGHFCLIAKTLWPQTKFDGLDFSESILEAKSRGWIEEGFHSTLDCAFPSLLGKYDVLSMYHYLEHSTDPVKDLEMAHGILVDGGYLLIEVPNPQCPLGKWLGRYWGPWLLPQHLNLFSMRQMEDLLRSKGFILVSGLFFNSKDFKNFSSALGLLFHQILPQNHPWQDRKPRFPRFRKVIALGLFYPLHALCALLDFVVSPYLEKGTRSAFYRVVAKKSSL
jgi:SAM-dependent methyltransferase